MTEAVLTYPNTHYTDNFSRNTKILNEYKLNMLAFLKQTCPEKSEQELIAIVDKTVKERYTSSELKYVSVPDVGNVDLKSGDLLELTNEMNENLITPYGAHYAQVDELKSLFSEYIEDNQKERKRVKHEMFLADLRGDKDSVRMNNLRQMNIKININVLSGVMLSSVTFRSAINYNAITSTSRFSIMNAYAAIELAFASNYYFENEDRAINWIVNLIRIYPGDEDISACMNKYRLAIPSKQKVFEDYAHQVKVYAAYATNEKLKQLIDSLNDIQVAFIYYAFNFQRIVQDNVHFRDFFTKMIDVDNIPLLEGEVPKIAKLPDGILQTLAVIFKSDKIGKLSIEDVDKEHPDVARHIYSTYIYVESFFKRVEYLFKTFMMLPIVPADIGVHKNMIRKTVLLSDTDSILFTNMGWVNWYAGNVELSRRASNFNAVVVSFASKFLEHVFGYMSASMGISADNLRILAIKNEFMYDVFLRTPISKHYAGYVRYREGVLQDPYKFDLKGKNFKGSDLGKTTTAYVKWFIKDIFDNFIKTYRLDPEDMIKKVIIFEQRIKQSIADGENIFLMQKPINQKESYTNPESSNYLYYELWQAVFAEKYGDLNLPQKTKELPISAVSVNRISPLDHMRVIDEGIYDKFVMFIKQYPNKEFSRILIPIDITIPNEVRAIADYRKVCALNCYSLDLVLKSLNITNYPNSKKVITLFSDTYPNLVMEISDEQSRSVKQQTDTIAEEEDDEWDEDDDDWFDDEEDKEI
jgi:hypothetical protein